MKRYKENMHLKERMEFVSLQKVLVALGGLEVTCGALAVHARTEVERAEWGVVCTKLAVTAHGITEAIEAVEGGADTWDVVDDARYVDLPRLYRLVGEADVLGRLHVRTIGTSAYTDIAPRVVEAHERLVRLGETHDENDPSLRPTPDRLPDYRDLVPIDRD